ncbi:transaldolase [Candidatus Magnetomonas plexicatena]|uniref:transaldolase n=1 Tax=Candidatus Magnetomonas plexicatena TaxID=2552947 RepID=UPI001103BA51|nr:transaldolase [Nitrospirales bacterium LBB_01]
MSKENPLIELKKAGQSFWYDNISREFISSGQLKSMIDNDGLLGITSNPSIFYKSIKNGKEYDKQMAELFKTPEVTPKEVFYGLEIKDIVDAAAVMYPVYEATKGVDGYVSIEVDPNFASDVQTTISEALDLFKRINRPNIMIKVPATKEGVEAVRELTAQGVNVNVTLLFSVKRYEDAVMAYIEGLEEALKRGGSIADTASVASFFISRIDTAIDKIFDARINATTNPDEKDWIESLKGKASVAYAKSAYQSMVALFSTERFLALKQRGARVQRLLWASTSTKNPAYSDTLYVDSLIGPQTINTMPHETVIAFKDHGTVQRTVDQGLDDASDILDDMSDLNINLDVVTAMLEEDGVRLFVEAFNSILDLIEEKKSAI